MRMNIIQAAKSQLLDSHFADISNESSLKIVISAQEVYIKLKILPNY